MVRIVIWNTGRFMTTAIFDALDYFEKLKAADVPDEQARVQANALRDFSALQEVKFRDELATKSDIQDVPLEMKSMELRLLKWLMGIGIAIFSSIFTALAKGFRWFGL